MGYRSSVAFCFTVDNYDLDKQECRDTFKKMLGFFKLSEFYSIVTQPTYNCIKSKELGWSWREGMIVFSVDDWKWYDSFPSVQAFEELWERLQELSNQDVPISGRFVRSGEDLEDNEENDFGEQPEWELAYINKSMTVDAGCNILGVTENEEGADEQVPADQNHCGQDADQECKTPRRGQAVRVCAEV